MPSTRAHRGLPIGDEGQVANDRPCLRKGNLTFGTKD
jgi:hypothetical protein